MKDEKEKNFYYNVWSVYDCAASNYRISKQFFLIFFISKRNFESNFVCRLSSPALSGKMAAFFVPVCGEYCLVYSFWGFLVWNWNPAGYEENFAVGIFVFFDNRDSAICFWNRSY